MKRLNLILIIALAGQLVLAGSLYLGGQDPVEADQKTLLTGFSKQDIQKVEISEAGDQQVMLGKMDDRWVLTEYFQLPTPTAKPDAMLAKLVDTPSGWPVATTKSSHERFKVADDSFNKKIVLTTDGEQSETIYVGTSPGFRQLHVRRAGDDNVYAVKLNSFDFPSKNSDWLDKTLLQPKDEITHVTGDDYSLRKQGDVWVMENSDGKLDTTEVDILINTLKQLRITEADERTLDDSAQELTVKAGDKSYQYLFSEVNDGYLVKRDDWPAVFRLSESDYENIALHKASTLVEYMGEPEQDELSESQPDDNSEAASESSS